ncbi:unnamed protein product [Prunus armeniaca]
MDSKGWTLCIPPEVIDSWRLKGIGRSTHLMRKHFVQAITALIRTSRRFVSSIETTAFGLLTRHRVFEHAVRLLRLSRGPCPFVSNSSANIKAYPSSFLPYTFRIFGRPNSAKLFSQFFNPFELHISALHLLLPSYLFPPAPPHLLKLGPKSSRLSLKTFAEKSRARSYPTSSRPGQMMTALPPIPASTAPL